MNWPFLPTTVMLLAACLRLSAQESLFSAAQTGLDSGPEGTVYELGTIFRTTVSGKVTHLRLYALASESGERTARLWRNSDNALIGGPWPWTAGGPAGWITLDIPDVSIAPNIDYTVSVSTGGGGRNYPFRSHDLDTAGGNGAHLTRPAGAGVFTTSSGTRPVSVFQNANYYRDILFTADAQEPPSDAPVRINEILAENESALADEDGEFSDWIELYNPRAMPVTLTGYQLADGSATWTFPNVVIGSQGFLVVFASGKDRSTLTLHTNFKLDGGGEALSLSDSGGTVISAFTPAFPRQHAGVSYGRGSNGNTGFMLSPTPGFSNGAALDGFVEDTVFSVKRGFFTAPVQVAITSATAGADIRYTLDGSVPRETDTLYTGPLSVSATTTLRARAFKANFVPTNTDTNTYVFAADLAAQTSATALTAGWPAGPVNGQVLRYGMNAPTLALYTTPEKNAALTQVPTLSIVTAQSNLTDPAAGLYVNAAVDGLERPVSFEMLRADGSPGFQIDAGLRIRGGQSRGGNFPKHSFNLFFREEYGEPKLEFPLFGNDGAKKFDTLSIRCEHGYAYADPHGLSYGVQFTAMRDVFCRDLWAAAGFASTRSGYCHLLLNGQYWGLYQTQERAQEDFAATYFGGSPAEYDGVAATGLPQLTIEATSGDLNAWTQLWNGARTVNANPSPANYFALLGRNADGTPGAAFPVLLSPRELAAYMLLHYYTGHSDEPLSVSFNFEKPNNFRALRRRGMTEPWHFIVHDGESSMRASEWVDNRANAVNLTSPNRASLTYSNPEWIHEDLLASPEYRIAFADEAQRLLFNDGAFTASKAQAHWTALASQIGSAVIGESIRWAQSTQESQARWAAEVDSVRTQFFPGRSGTVVAQLRQRNLFPSVGAPVFSQRGGQVSAGFQLSLSAAAGGTIYYTLDGSDPRAIGGAVAGIPYASPVSISGPVIVRTRFLSATGEWSALDEAVFSTSIPASAANFIVSKIHYHPLPPSAGELASGFNADNDFEYLEFQNTSASTIDLRGVKVDAGIDFDFASAPVTLLAPGARVVIVENAAAFAFRYGASLPVAGSFTGNLSDGGETLRIVDAAGGVIALFAYDDSSPWPVSPDGLGPSLVLKAPGLDPALPASWRSSYSTGGYPGTPDVLTLADWRSQYFSASDLADPSKEATVWGNLADPDGDGYANLAEFALSGSPVSAASSPVVTAALFAVTPADLRLQATFRYRDGTSGVSLTPQFSNDLISWSGGSTVVAGPADAGDGYLSKTVQDNSPNRSRFFRLLITAP
ncbi:MAG TPA: lamin tail domain-containing protein [Verrucomicrobiales bacterium]|nr:lamin tail domain-containing protein [Verrucomicrobiales bacterium]